MTIAMLGIDLGKNSCGVVEQDATGLVVPRRWMRRETVMTFGAKLPPGIVAMEACCGVHHMGRALAAKGHTVRLMPPEYVRPYVKAREERRPRRRGDRGGRDPSDHAVRRAQVGGTAQHADSAPGA